MTRDTAAELSARKRNAPSAADIAASGDRMMKTTTATKTPAKVSTKPKDLKPKKEAKGGIGLLLPAVQKIRDAG